MFSAGTLTFQEFMAHEKLPLATIQNAVLEFLRDRKDVAVFGAQAVNAYVREPRMTQDIDLLSTRAEDLAAEILEFLRQRFRIAVRMREIGKGKGFRLYQVQKPRNRHLVDIRPVAALPPTKRISKVLVVTPPELIANKVISYHQRRGKPKSGTDWRDLAMLLLTFPELKRESGPVRERLQAAEVDSAILAVWNELVTQEIMPVDEDDEF
ncbi:nucleotidyl transferase AbiEii/AbiGii toxin family protein [candidate division KSB1 bacterium]|nr:nucleotidyl transferase AbiEii/AbiGii toxin family protein [candidate division KSB1 bacterium]